MPRSGKQGFGNETIANRRNFLSGGAAIGAAIALTGVAAAEPGDSEASQAAFLNARDLGARGDGKTDDTAALKEAIARATAESVGIVFLPAGTYLLSDVLHLPSNLCLKGAGPGLTVLQAVNDTRFPLFRPDPRTQEVRQRRSMVTTTSVGSVRESVVENVALSHLTIDWNHCPTDGYGSSCVLMDSADRCRLDQVHFTRCLPSDHPRQLEEMKGSGFRSECIMFSNCRGAVMDGCQLVDSGYRPLSVAYGSLDITFQNGRIVASNPVWRHAFAEVHGDGIPRDEHYVRSQAKFFNSTFVLEGGTAQDGICSHTGTVVIENCDFYILKGTEHFAFVVKPFDASWRCQCLNNRFHCEGDYEQAFSVIGSIGEKQNEDMLFVGNLIKVAFREGIGTARKGQGLVDFGRNEKRCRVQGNQFLIQFDNPVGTQAIRLENTHAFTVSDNQIEFQGANGTLAPVGIGINQCKAGTVTGNIVMGDCQTGLQLGETLDQVVVSNNCLPTVSDDLTGQAADDLSPPEEPATSS